MTEHFHAVVVGSGFGGSVVTSRLARAGLKVCLLERGAAFPPGSFARAPREMRGNLWDPSEGLYGLFNVWSFDGLDALVSSGLGGGSLIYANVLLPMPESWFRDPELPGGRWPISLADLSAHYDAVRSVLTPTPYPLNRPPYDRTPKTRAFQRAAAELGLDWELPPLAISFNGHPHEPPVRPDPLPGTSLDGRPRFACRLCGECDVGCNHGSKNTLDHTYLKQAQDDGAEVRPLCEVKAFRSDPFPPHGFTIEYVQHRTGTPRPRSPQPIRVVADTLVLSAGALGSTYLLLRNRQRLDKISEALGTRFSGNGDLLTFLAGGGLDPADGPVITSTVRVPDTVDGGDGRGFLIQEGGYPEFAKWLLDGLGVHRWIGSTAGFALRRLWARLRRDPRTNISREISALLSGEPPPLPLLGMGRDVPDGTMSLRRDRLQNDWSIDSSREYFARVRKKMEAIAERLDADLIDPLELLDRVVTVHPLGGCPMGRNADEGVVDNRGAVFNNPGLYVADGSVLPGPAGTNPALTIAAFADRVADRILEDHGRASR